MFIEPTPGVGKFSPEEFSSNPEKDPHLQDSDYVYMDINTPILIRLRQYSD